MRKQARLALRLLAGVFALAPSLALAQYTDYRIATNESTGKTGVAAPAGIQMLGLKATGTANAIAAIGDASGRTIVATEAAAPLVTDVVKWGGTAVTGGAGAATAGSPRMILATDDPAVTALQIIDDWDETDRAKVNPIVGQAGVAGGAGLAGATVQRVTVATDDVVSVDDNAASLTVDNAALSVVGGGVEATALRVTVASDSTGVLSVDDNAGSLTVDAPAGTPLAVRQSDGATAQTFEVVDVDTGGPVVSRIGAAILLPGAGGAVAGGTSANPVRTDPTGTTAQPVTDNAGSLTVDAPVATPLAARLSDGAAFYDATKTGQLPAALVGGRLDVVVGAALPTGANVIGALSANQTVNVAQINGVTPLMGNGATGTGAQRVSIASDSTGVVYQGDGFTSGSGRPSWPMVNVQRENILNSTTTGAANTAVVVTIAAVAGTKVYLHKVTGRCSGAGFASISVKDDATIIWDTGTTFISDTNVDRSERWQPPLTSEAVAKALEITLGACGAGSTGTLAIQASQF